MLIEYSYVIIKYRHDKSAGEILNVAVVAYSPATGAVGMTYSPRFARLSEAFANFNGDLYKQTMGRLNSALERLGSSFSKGLFQLEEREKFADAGALMRAIWPDQGLGYFAGATAYGETQDLGTELRSLFDRFVISQHDPRDVQARFDDEAVWSDLKRLLTQHGVANKLTPKTLGAAAIEFEHAWKNERWHVIEAVSLDYANASEIKQRALLTFGKAAAVRDVEELGSMTVVIAKPRRISADKQYHEAMRLFADLPVPHEIVEEQNAERFVVELTAKMAAHDGAEVWNA